MRCICRGGAQRFSSMTRLGCRYLMLTISAKPAPSAFVLGIRHATIPPSGEGFVRTSDETLNAIFHSRRTHLNCTGGHLPTAPPTNRP